MTTNHTEDIYAALDLGSNSFHLLIARFEGNKLVVIDRHKEMVRLAEGLLNDGSLSKKVIKRAIESLRRFAERLRPTPATHFKVIGTNTLRQATNADHFLEQAEYILGAPIDIISGIEEARLIFMGVAQDLSVSIEKRMVMDIGGGSTEFIVGNDQPEHLESIEMGCVTYSRRFFADGKLSKKAYQKAVITARAEIQEIAHDFNSANWHEAVGTSGTIKAIEKVLYAMGEAGDHTITPAGLVAMSRALLEFNDTSDIKLPGLSDERKPVIAGGLAVLHAAFLELGIERMHVSSYAAREGSIMDLAGKVHRQDTRERTVKAMSKRFSIDTRHAERVSSLASNFLSDVKTEYPDNYVQVRQLLDWSARLHELGLMISHQGYHKHSAYLLANSEMPGFSKQEQKYLSFLVQNHRKKLKSMPQTYGFEPDWLMVSLLRLACLFNRRREDNGVPENLQLNVTGDKITLTLPEPWLREHPLTQEDLLQEKHYLQQMDIRLKICH
ncbi:Exopolyphosphatase [BD1-7 clade bacterium]|uniref:Exopolyphosphatase n=1 Tax=BD1-7 clade bacterium TaxID=2029982 RepID=A0A5S9QUF2_9GAMM|nr:Exopolyphosphatase [BD1-7 clade bacterium]